MTFEVRHYTTVDGIDLFGRWVEGLTDRQARARIQTRIARLALGNFGDCRALGGGVSELRVHWGPGYRVYFARAGTVIVLLLCGGDKATQQRDIEHAKAYLQDYKSRTEKTGAPKRRA